MRIYTKTFSITPCSPSAGCIRAVSEIHTMLLHNAQELHHNLGRWADENLALSATLSIHNAHEGVVLFMWISFVACFPVYDRTSTEILTMLDLKVTRRKLAPTQSV